MHHLDLDSGDTLFYHKSVQDNLKELQQRYGDRFILVCSDIELPCLLRKSPIYYELVYDYRDSTRTHSLLPFKIVFGDWLTRNKNNNCWFANLHRTEQYRGRQIFEATTNLLKKLSVEKVYITDGANVEFSTGTSFILSLYKLLEKGQTYYQSLGFKFQMCQFHHFERFADEQELETALLNSLTNLQLYNCNTIRRQYKQMLVKLLRNPNPTLFRLDPSSYGGIRNSRLVVKDEKKPQVIEKLLVRYKKIVDALSSSPSTSFREFLVQCVKDKNPVYLIFEQEITELDVIGVQDQDGSDTVWLDVVNDFHTINSIGAYVGYVLDLAS